MDKIKQKTPKHEAETCWNNNNKAILYFAKLSENKVMWFNLLKEANNSQTIIRSIN